MIVAPGSTSVSIDVFFADDTGAALTGKVAADFPACKWSGGGNTADTTITLSDLSLITTAHPNDNTAGGIKEREGGWYRLDLPNNMVSAAGRKRLTFAETTNKRILSEGIDVQYVQGDLQTIKTQAVTCAAGVTVGAFVGNATAAIVIDASGRVDLGKILGTASAGAVGYVGVDWGHVNAPTTTVALTGTTIAVTQKVDVDTIKTNPVVNAGTVTFPTSATLASTTNITAGVITTVTNQLTAAAIATGVWTDTTASDFTTALSIGKSVLNGVTLGTGLTINDITTKTGFSLSGTQTFSNTGTWTGGITGNVGGNVVGSVGSVTAAVSLTSAYDAAKTASQAGDAMALTSGERTTLTAAIWAALTSGLTTAGSIGKRLADFVTTLVYAAAPTAAVNAAAVRTELTTELGRIDAATTSRMATFTLPTNFSALGIGATGHVLTVDTCATNTDMRGTDSAALASSWTPTRAAYLDNLSSGVVPTAAQITTAVAAQITTDHGSGAYGATGALTGPQIAAAVWRDVVPGDFTVVGSSGALLAAAGGAADPLLNAVPGSYASGTAGAALGRIGTASITTTSPVAQGGAVELYRGDSYKTADGRALTWTGRTANVWPDLNGASIHFLTDDEAIEATGSVVTPTGTQVVRVELTSTNTNALKTGTPVKYFVVAILASGGVDTLATGTITVRGMPSA